ncbi:MAG: hypothetical protein RL236_102 [Pseudomonadota bacterium]|jgi:ABC-type uncharacterized transport system permease subunit
MMKFIAISSMLAYGINTGYLVWQLRTIDKKNTSLLFAWLAVALQTLYIGLRCQQQNGFSFSILSVASLNILGVALVLLLTALTKPVETLGIIVFPMAAIILGLDVIINPLPHLLPVHTGAMGIHISTSILAFSLLTIAAIQAILLKIQNKQLKQHPPTKFILLLPSLQSMETLLFQMIASGVFILSLSLGTGFLFLHDLFAQHLVHKTVLSLLAWVIFCAILIGRQRYGWRGRVAVNWILVGFLFLLLSYFGSKFVLELILVRT